MSDQSRQQTTDRPPRILPMFPILWGHDVKDTMRLMRKEGSPYLPVCIPFAMIDPHEKQAQRNHGQSLERLAERGGLSPCEALAVLDDRPWRSMPTIDACEELCRCMAQWIDAEIVNG